MFNPGKIVTVFFKRILPGFFIALILLAGCGQTQNYLLDSTTVEGYNYNQYLTYQLGRGIQPGAENIRFKSLQFDERMINELHFQLKGLGMENRFETPGLLIYYFTPETTDGQLPILPYEYGAFQDEFLNVDEDSTRNLKNLLFVDFVDNTSGQLVWRGIGELPSQDENQIFKRLPKLVYSIVRAYPN